MSGGKNYVYIQDDVHAKEVVDHLSGFSRLGYDVETTGLNIIGGEDRLLLMQLGTEEVAYLFDPRKMNPMLLQGILENPNILKIGHNLKFDYQATRCELGIQLDNLFDTMLAYRLLNSGLVREAASGKLVPNGLANKNKKQFPYKGLNFLTEHFLGISLDKSVRSSFSDRQYDREFTDKQLAYAADDVLFLHPLCDILSQKLENEGLIDTAILEFDFLRAVSEMEINGVCIDEDHWRKIIADCAQYRDQIARKISEILEPFQDQNTLFGTSTVNIGSKEQILDAFHKLGYEIENTEEKTLKKIDHELAKALLEWRGYDKLISTYGEAILRRINRNTNRLHFTLLQLGTHTGRLSSEKPNIQNIPQDKDEGEVTVSFRECFRAAPGYKILTADYSQCITEDELISTQWGLVPICQFSPSLAYASGGSQGGDLLGHAVPSFAGKGLVGVDGQVSKGEKSTVQVRTVDGFQLSCTPDHLVKVVDDYGNERWKDASTLTSGDHLVLSRDWVVDRQNPSIGIHPDEFIFLGYFTGSGSFSDVGLQIAKSVGKYGDVFCKLDAICKKHFDGKRLKDQPNTTSWNLIGKHFHDYMGHLGVHKSWTAATKEIPWSVLEGGRPIISSFLKGLFEASGWVDNQDSSRAVVFSSRSEVLSRQVQLLLLSLGIFSKRSNYEEAAVVGGREYSGTQWRISICDPCNIVRFYEQVGFLSVQKNRSLDLLLELSHMSQAGCENLGLSETKNHLAFSKVQAVTCGPIRQVYDLSVPEQRMFVAGGIFVHNCELRILAEVSQDKRFIEIFESGGDLHIITAQQVFGFSDVELEIFKKVKKEDHPDNNLLDLFSPDDLSVYHRISDFRSKTKVINFGIAYGLSAWSLAERFKISTEEAEGILNDYFSTYYGIKRWLDKNGHESIALRHSKTILGRKRYYHLPDPEDEYLFRKSKNSVRRAGNNAVIQGTNADITKEALNRLQREYDKLGYGKLLFTVHDEIVSEIPVEKTELVAGIKAEVMRQAFHRFVKTVPVGKDDKVSVTVADHWTK